MPRKKPQSDKRNPKWCVNIITDSLPTRPASQTDPDLAAKARKHGINPETACYYPQLARYPGDPEAFVSSKTDIKKALEKRGWGGEGIVNVKPRNDSDPAYKKNDNSITIHDVIRWE